MEEITDFQIRLLKICDNVRWSEEEQLDGFKYHLIRRQVGKKDHILEEELKLAVDAMQSGLLTDLDTPPRGSSDRSPWMATWDISYERYMAAGEVDMFGTLPSQELLDQAEERL